MADEREDERGNKNASGKNLTFEEKIKRLEEIVRALESGTMGLKESISLYREGKLLAEECRRELENARLTVEKLDAVGGLQPLEEENDVQKE